MTAARPPSVRAAEAGKPVRTAMLVSAFDIVDAVDLDLLRQASHESDRVSARVLGDATIQPLTGWCPVLPERDRLEIVRSLRNVSEARLFDPAERFEGPGSVVMYGRSDHFAPSLPVQRWVRPQHRDDTAAVDAARTSGEEHPAGFVVGYVPGAWDLFHIGHLNLLRRARAHCDRLVVGVVTDSALASAKGHPPEVPLAERMAVVGSMDIVDEVVVDFSSSKLAVWERVHFDVVFKGSDWRGTPKGDRLEAEMARVKARVHYFPYTQQTSSTRLREVRAGRSGSTLPEVGPASAAARRNGWPSCP